MQIEGFDYYHTAYENLNKRQAVNPVVSLLYQHERGQLTDGQLADALLPYRTNDNRKQIEDEFARVGIVHQHNLAISGGSNKIDTWLLLIIWVIMVIKSIKVKIVLDLA